MLRASYEAQIKNFGQCPAQLFTRAHPPRDKKPRSAGTGAKDKEKDGGAAAPAAAVIGPTRNVFADSPIVAVLSVPQQLSVGASLLGTGGGSRAAVVDAAGRVALVRFSSGATGGAGAVADALGITQSPTFDVVERPGPPLVGCTAELHQLSSAGAFGVRAGRIALGCAGSNAVMLMGGSCDGYLRAASCLGGTRSASRLLQTLGRAVDRTAISSLAMCEDFTSVVCGHSDGSIEVWSLNEEGGKKNSAVVCSSPLAVLYGHSTRITALAVSSALNVVVSSSTDGATLVHTLRQGDFVRSLNAPGLTFEVRLASSLQLSLALSRVCVLAVFR